MDIARENRAIGLRMRGTPWGSDICLTVRTGFAGKSRVRNKVRSFTAKAQAVAAGTGRAVLRPFHQLSKGRISSSAASTSVICNGASTPVFTIHQ